MQEDDRGAKLKHQLRFLSQRGLTPLEVEDANTRLRTIERLVGKDASKLDPKLRERVDADLEKAALDELRVWDLIDEWLAAWDTHKAATARRLVVLEESALVGDHTLLKTPSSPEG